MWCPLPKLADLRMVVECIRDGSHSGIPRIRRLATDSALAELREYPALCDALYDLILYAECMGQHADGVYADRVKDRMARLFEQYDILRRLMVPDNPTLAITKKLFPFEF